MTGNEFSAQFDVLYNNITSNQAPGLNEYEKSVFLTKAQDELIKNYFLPQSNAKQAGYDGNQKRQMDFSLLMKVKYCLPVDNGDEMSYGPGYENQAGAFDPRGRLFAMPEDLFIPINENLRFGTAEKTEPATATILFQRQVIPLSYEEYTRLMSKPYKEPLKYQAWRILVNNSINGALNTAYQTAYEGKLAEVIANHNDLKWLEADTATGSVGTGESTTERVMQYVVRYIRRPKPILVAQIDSYGVSIHGHDGSSTDGEGEGSAFVPYYTLDTDNVSIVNPCELDESLHEEILQRAVELAKVAWQGDVNSVIQAGQRSE